MSGRPIKRTLRDRRHATLPSPCIQRENWEFETDRERYPRDDT